MQWFSTVRLCRGCRQLSLLLNFISILSSRSDFKYNYSLQRELRGKKGWETDGEMFQFVAIFVIFKSMLAIIPSPHYLRTFCPRSRNISSAYWRFSDFLSAISLAYLPFCIHLAYKWHESDIFPPWFAFLLIIIGRDLQHDRYATT